MGGLVLPLGQFLDPEPVEVRRDNLDVPVDLDPEEQLQRAQDLFARERLPSRDLGGGEEGPGPLGRLAWP